MGWYHTNFAFRFRGTPPGRLVSYVLCYHIAITTYYYNEFYTNKYFNLLVLLYSLYLICFLYFQLCKHYQITKILPRQNNTSRGLIRNYTVY